MHLCSSRLRALPETVGQLAPLQTLDISSNELSALPSELFLKQCFIATDSDEALVAQVVDRFGDANIVMSIDYPHADGGYPNGIREFLALPGLGLESKKKIMWDNCRKLYGFGHGRGGDVNSSH